MDINQGSSRIVEAVVILGRNSPCSGMTGMAKRDDGCLRESCLQPFSNGYPHDFFWLISRQSKVDATGILCVPSRRNSLMGSERREGERRG
ncbi:hypothetical protein TIFTF001_031009 [Ficus carica]|uniref:Uncharacterized protein n=1 Tax=Ficus carica TaxID=3494 RepID=A0AA88J5R8_FICCA|nr:hypothetical protein TIFTF001_031009 [Ficus carica]